MTRRAGYDGWRRWWVLLVLLPALGVLAVVWLTPISPLVVRLPVCLSQWRVVIGQLHGSYVMVRTYRVSMSSIEVHVESPDGKLLGVVHPGEERSWTCDWPATWIKGFSGDSA